MKRRVNQLA